MRITYQTMVVGRCFLVIGVCVSRPY